jgi:hypothetical protein
MKLVALLVTLLAAAHAYADDCAPQVTLDGDATLVARLGPELAARGIATSGNCPARVARIERRDGMLVISISDDARTVSEIKTAAAVIESFVRDDVGSPLLAIRMPPRARATEVALAPSTPAPQLPRGWHFFGGFEASLASDHSRWMGMQLGACRMIGVLCAAVRLRGGTVTNDEGQWTTTRRHTGEFLVGFDIPFRIRSYLLMPGVALGYGDLTTKTDEMSSRSNNFRGQAHVSLSVPLTRSLALDLYTAVTLVQQVEREPGYMTTIGEPLGYLRFGVAMRYGSR